MTQSVRFITLGCKVNQYESQAMRESLESRGVREWSKDAPLRNDSAVDFVVINTCTVTQVADKENLYWIRRARREHPRAKIVVTGCFVGRNYGEIESIPDVDLILANEDKSELTDRLLGGCGVPSVQDDGLRRERRRRFTPLTISRAQGKSRAFVKIQDGCNHACSFCKVVLVRGRSRSRMLKDIVEEAHRLSDSGYREIVLAGIQLGAYGDDLNPRIHLVDVLEALTHVGGIERLRLSSIEPTDVRPELIEALATLPQCCPHLHIPLQSGDNAILERMNRRYSREFYIDLIERLKSQLPDFSLTLDVMAGFPGEEERHFENTAQLLDRVRPLKCHVFPYSRRDGTRAARWTDVPAAAVRGRVDALIAKDRIIGRAIRLKYLNRVMNVLVEKIIKGNLVQGITSNYLKVCFQAQHDAVGNIFPVRFMDLQDDLFLGRIEQAVISA